MLSYICVKQDFTAGWHPYSLWTAIFYKKHFIFHMLPYKLFIWAGLIAHFGWPLFKFWLKPVCVWISKFCTYDINHQTLHWSFYLVYYHSNIWPLKSNCWQQGYIWNKHPSIKQILHLAAVCQNSAFLIGRH